MEAREICVKFNEFHANFDHFSAILDNISRVAAKVRFRGRSKNSQKSFFDPLTQGWKTFSWYTSRMQKFFDLLYEIQERIFFFVPGSDLKQFSLCSRDAYNVVQQSLWRHVRAFLRFSNKETRKIVNSQKKPHKSQKSWKKISKITKIFRKISRDLNLCPFFSVICPSLWPIVLGHW